MRPAFVGHPIVEALFFATLGIWGLTELRQAVRRRAGATNRDRGSRKLLAVFDVAAALIAAAALRTMVGRFNPGDVGFAASLAIMWCGVALRWWSFWTLGRYFTFNVMTSADQPVITGGPYRWLRHPSYLGILLVLAGIGLSYGNWLSAAALVILPFAGFAYRIRVEEAALASELGAAYTDFARTRKRLIPFVW